jgi:hypothetical protein
MSIVGGQDQTFVALLCDELGINPVMLYRYVGPTGELREHRNATSYPS